MTCLSSQLTCNYTRVLWKQSNINVYVNIPLVAKLVSPIATASRAFASTSEHRPNKSSEWNMCVCEAEFERRKRFSSRNKCRSSPFYTQLLRLSRHATNGSHVLACREDWPCAEVCWRLAACGGCVLGTRLLRLAGGWHTPTRAGRVSDTSVNRFRDILSIRTPFRTSFSPTDSFWRDESFGYKITFRGWFDF